MVEKLLFFDLETTGLNPKIHEPWQMAFIVEIDGVVKTQQAILVQPINFDTISQSAMDMAFKQDGSPVTLQDLSEFPEPIVIYRYIQALFGEFINKYDSQDKFIAVGQNIGFDIDMLGSWFEKLGDKYFGSWIDRKKSLDVLAMTRWLWQAGCLPGLANGKLQTVCEHLGICLGQAHDALSDITATREVYHRYMNVIKYVKDRFVSCPD